MTMGSDPKKTNYIPLMYLWNLHCTTFTAIQRFKQVWTGQSVGTSHAVTKRNSFQWWTAKNNNNTQWQFCKATCRCWHKTSPIKRTP